MASTVTELLRRRFGGKSLPYDAEIEYLESTGTQWIDTGYMLNDRCRVQGKLKLYNISSVYAIWGAREKNDYSNNYSMFNVNYHPRADYGNVMATHSFNYINENSKVIIVFDINAGTAVVNGDTYIFSDSLKPFNCPASATIFTVNSGEGVDQRFSTGEIVYFKISDENGILVRDFIPVRVGTTGYMYDKVSGQLFGNSGTGDFILGNDK